MCYYYFYRIIIIIIIIIVIIIIKQLWCDILDNNVNSFL